MFLMPTELAKRFCKRAITSTIRTRFCPRSTSFNTPFVSLYHKKEYVALVRESREIDFMRFVWCDLQSKG